MKKIWKLVNVQIWSLISNTIVYKNKKSKTRAVQAGLAAFVIVMSAVAYIYCYAIGQSLMLFDAIQILPPLVMSIACMIVLVNTMLKVRGTIFGFKDYDMVMSLPISTETVVISRLALLYLYNMIFVIMIIIPMMIAYGILAKPNITFYIIGIFTMLLIPLVPIIIATVFGTIIAYVASKFRHSNLLHVVFSLILIFAFMILPGTMEGSEIEIVNIAKLVMEEINRIYPLAGLYKEAIVNGNLNAIIIYIGISIGAFLLYVLVMGKVFKKVNTAIMTSKYRTTFKLHGLKQSAPLVGLYKKEIKRYFSSPLYVLNTCFGVVFLTIGAIAIFFVDINTVLGEQIPMEYLTGYLPMVFTFCIIVTCTTMSSISLEGNSLWILKSLPMTPKTIYISKIAVNLTIAAPILIDTLLVSVALKLGWVNSLMLLLMSACNIMFIALYGLVINLKFPNFEWTTEAAVIKQSVATLIVTVTSFLIVGLQVLLVVIIPSMLLAFIIYVSIVATLILILYRILVTWGIKRFILL